MKINKIRIAGLLSGLMIFALIRVALALDLTLTKIGTLSTIGVDYSVVNHTGIIPALEGTASLSAQVLIRVKTAIETTSAGILDGVWRLTPATLDPGANAIVITSGLQSLSFVINYSATPAATPTVLPVAQPTQAVEELPATGIWEYYLPAIGLGLVVLFLGKNVKKRMLAWEGRRG